MYFLWCPVCIFYGITVHKLLKIHCQKPDLKEVICESTNCSGAAGKARMSQEEKNCNSQPSPILAAGAYVRSVRCLEAIATSAGGFQGAYSSCQAPEGNKDPPGSLTKPLLTS